MKHWSPSNDMVNGCLTTVITIVGQGVTSIGTMVDVEFVGSHSKNQLSDSMKRTMQSCTGQRLEERSIFYALHTYKFGNLIRFAKK